MNEVRDIIREKSDSCIPNQLIIFPLNMKHCSIAVTISLYCSSRIYFVQIMSKLVIFNKPFNTLCQFTGEEGDITLAEFIDIKNVYPAGRLDKDSEGLLLLTDDGQLQNQIANPKNKMSKTYWVQVEGAPTDKDLEPLRRGLIIQKYRTKPASAKIIDTPSIWPRTPPVRERKNVPDTWLELTIREGKNRQVRRMTAAIGFPTLRLIRAKIGQWSIDQLLPGEYRLIDVDIPTRKISNKPHNSRKRFSNKPK